MLQKNYMEDNSKTFKFNCYISILPNFNIWRRKKMKKKIVVGIIMCMLLIAVALPAVGKMNISEEYEKVNGNNRVDFQSEKDNNIIYHADFGAGIWRMNSDGSGQTQLTNHGWFAEYSPDNTKIAFGDFYNNGIWVMNADGTGQIQLTASGGAPTWSPDSSKIAYFVGDQTGASRRIWVMNVDGTGATQISDNPGSFPKWSPDGTKIAYHGEVNNGIWLINPDGTGEVQLYAGGAYPTWSPDGKQMAYTLLSDWCIWIMNADGTGKTKISNQTGDLADWCANGIQIAFEHADGIWIINTDGTNEYLINKEGHAPDWSLAPCCFEVRIKPGLSLFTVSADVIEICNQDHTNVPWKIEVSGGLWIPASPATFTGTIGSIPAGGSTTIQSGLLLGLGSIEVKVTVDTCQPVKKNGLILFFLILM